MPTAAATSTHPDTTPAIVLNNATVLRGGRPLWRDLSLTMAHGECLAVLGPNGTGKTIFLKVLLGLVPLNRGSVHVEGDLPTHQRHTLGYVPQQQPFDPDVAIRGRDLVDFGLRGTEYGLGVANSTITAKIDATIAELGATSYADAPLGLLSGGEQQRLRIAQALVADPSILMCDEPFLSLDVAAQQTVSELITKRKAAGTAVVFVTHDLNAAILPIVDRVLYFANGRFAVGEPNDVLTTKRLTELYGTPVSVLRVGGRILVIPGATESHPNHVAARRRKKS